MNDTATWKWKIAQTLEYKWWQNYLKNKDTEEYISWKCLYWNKLLQAISEYTEISRKTPILKNRPDGRFAEWEAESENERYKFKKIWHRKLTATSYW